MGNSEKRVVFIISMEIIWEDRIIVTWKMSESETGITRDEPWELRESWEQLLI